MESNKRKSRGRDATPGTSYKLQKSSQLNGENENLDDQHIQNAEDSATVLAESPCPSIVKREDKTSSNDSGAAMIEMPGPSTVEDTVENETCTSENVQTLDEIEARRIQELLRIVDDMVLHNTDSQLIVRTVTNDLRNALECLTEPYVVVPFGSFINGLVCHGSDLDFYLESPRRCRTSNEIQSLLKTTARALRKSRMFKNVCPIPSARVPIVKFSHKKSECLCDLSFTNEIGVRNTLLIRFYLSVNENLKPLVLSLKHLLELYDLQGCQKITTYMLFWLAVYYMQQCDILPSVLTVRELVHESYTVNEWDSRVPSPFLVPVRDSLSLLSHLKGFLKFYSEFSFLKYVISPYLACPLMVDDFENMRLPLDLFSTYFQKIEKVEDNTFNFSTINLQDPTELNVNITKQVELPALNQFRFFCNYFFNFFNEDITKEQLAEHPLKEMLPKTVPTNDGCIHCEIVKITVNRLSVNHPLRKTFKINGVQFFANRLKTLLESIYKCDLEESVSDQIIRIYRRRKELCRKKVPVAYLKCFCSKEIVYGGRRNEKVISSEKKEKDFELCVLIDSSFGGDEVNIRFECKIPVWRHLFTDVRIRQQLIQLPE